MSKYLQVKINESWTENRKLFFSLSGNMIEDEDFQGKNKLAKDLEVTVAK